MRMLSNACAAAIAMIGGAFLGVGAADAAEVNLRLSHTQAVGTANDQASQFFAKRVGELTNGEVAIQVFPANALGNERQVIELVQLGSVDFGLFSNDVMSAVVPELGVVILPYLIRDKDHIRKVWASPVGEELIGYLQKKQMRSLARFEYGFRAMLTTNRPIRAAGDIKGLRIRVIQAPVPIKIWQLLGASPVPLVFDEVYTALSSGVIEAMEAGPDSMYNNKLYEKGKHLTMTDHQFTGSHLIVSDTRFQALKPAHQQAMVAAAKEAEPFQRKVAGELDQSFVDKLLATGVTQYKIDTAPLKVLVEPIYADFDQGAGKGLGLVQKVRDVK